MTAWPPSIPSRVAPTRGPGRAQARGDRTRAFIIDETVRCILDEGFAAASAKHIADRAGVTWGVIQYHFGDRNGLLAAVVGDGYENFRASIASVAIPSGPATGRLAAVVDAAWTAFSAPASRASLEILIATRGGRGPERTTELEAMAREMRRLGGMLVGDEPDRRSQGRMVGEVLWAALRGLVLAQMVTNQPLDSRRERAMLVDLIGHYLERNGTSR